MMFWSFGSNEDSECNYSDESSEHINWNEDSGSAISEGEYKLKKLHGKYLQLENSYLEQISDVLQDGLNGTINFIAEDEFRSTDIKIEVEKVGKLSFPLKSSCIQKLIDISTKACFGKGEETILNKDVRDTHEIPGRNLKVIFRENSLSQMLDRVRSKIVFAKNCNLEVELHNMLIYGPGQFFDLHQDSEKATNMIGTLVIIVPSPHIGGNLIVQHGTKEHIFVSENLASKNFKCVSFYADCKHKIEKVREGFRVALTYKLILRREENSPLQPVNQSLKIAMQNYFSNIQTLPPKLVFFLDHSYTKHGLRWHLLKGEDQINGEALISVGKELNLIAYLVLVEIHHMWNNGGDYQTSRIIDIELDEVEYTLSHWINSNNEMHSLGDCMVQHREICWTKETNASYKPMSSGCDGFTGNEGLTVDHWYNRAAVVLWPSSSEVQMKFEIDPKKALQEMQAVMSSPGQEEEVKHTVETAGEFLYQNLSGKSGFEELVQIALYIKDKPVSLPILSHFEWTLLNCDISEGLAKLESLYGVDWCIDLLNKWRDEEAHAKHTYYMSKTDKVLKKINIFVDNYLRCEGSLQIVHMILSEQATRISLVKEPAGRNSATELKKRLTERMEIIYEFFISCATAQNSSLIEQILEHINSIAPLYPESNLADMYLQMKKEIPSSNLTFCEPLKAYLQKNIGAIITSGMRAKNDWSITEKLYCECKICKRINTFLHSKTEMKKGWLVVKKERDHIIYELGWLPDLPVSTKSNAKQLVMIKTERLHKDAHRKFTEFKQYLNRLNSQV